MSPPIFEIFISFPKILILKSFSNSWGSYDIVEFLNIMIKIVWYLGDDDVVGGRANSDVSLPK